MSDQTSELAHALLSALAALPVRRGDRALVAVSGGADSLALADLLHRTRDAHGIELVLAHVDHGIHAESGAAAAVVANFAAERGLPLHVRRLELGALAGETVARERRYAALDDMRREAGARWIVTAHHADDQVETVLMRFLHGSGPAGLAGMGPMRGRVLRPLLGIARKALAAHAARHALPVWSDPANADPRHERAWLRGTVLPVLRSRLPGLDAQIERTAAQAARDRDAWDALLDALPELALRREPGGISVAAPQLAGYDSRLATALVRAAGRRAGIVIGTARAARVLALAASGRSGASIPLGSGTFAELAFGRLRLLRRRDGPPAEAVLLSETRSSGEARWGRWAVRWEPARAPAEQPRNGMTAWFVPDAKLRVREWRPGDRLLPLGGSGRRLLVRCFQDARVPRSRRAEWPVIESGGQVVWAPGVCRAQGLVPQEGSEALRVDVAYA